MYTLITYPSAYSFWMHNDFAVQRVAQTDAVTNMAINSDPGYYEELAAMLHIKTPIHCMIPSRSARRAAENTVFHLSPVHLPRGYFIEIAPSVCVLSPELCYLLSARELSVPQLVMEATNLCGSYYYDAEGKHQNRRNVTSIGRLSKTLDGASDISGIKRARQALQYASEKTNSPMETKLAAYSRVPLNQGGAAFPVLDLNEKIFLSSEGKNLLQCDYCICDLVWKEKKVIVEYDSKQHHMEENRFLYDKTRTFALSMSGYRVYGVTSSHLGTQNDIEGVFSLLRNALNIRKRPDRLEKYKEKRKRTIREIFFTPEPWELY